MKTATWKNITLEMPVGLVLIEDITITEEMGEHGRATITGLLEEGEEKNVIEKFTMDTKMKIIQDGQVLFCGLPVNVSVEQEGESYELFVELISSSVLLDIEKQSKSYQDKSNTYQNIFKELVGKVNGECLDLASKGAAQKGPYIRYQETSWEFIKRMASYVGAKVCAVCDEPKPKIVVGIQKGKSHTEKCYEYKIQKDMKEILTKRNQVSGVKEKSFPCYQVESQVFYHLGDMVTYQGNPYIVYRRKSAMQKEELIHTYEFRQEAAIVQEPLYQEELSGVSIIGTILAIEGDKLKLHLSIDEGQDKGKAYPYSFTSSYTANGSTGWFAMPEIGQSVELFIPGKDETKAYITKVSRTDGADNSKTSDPSTKYFGTAEGKEMVLSPSDITFTAKEGETYLTLSGSEGVTVQTSKDISLKTDQGVEIFCESFEATSKDKIILATQNTSIIVDDVMHIKG